MVKHNASMNKLIGQRSTLSVTARRLGNPIAVHVDCQLKQLKRAKVHLNKGSIDWTCVIVRHVRGIFAQALHNMLKNQHTIGHVNGKTRRPISFRSFFCLFIISNYIAYTYILYICFINVFFTLSSCTFYGH